MDFKKTFFTVLCISISEKKVRSLRGMWLIKFKYSEKATKFCEILTLLLSYLVTVKSKGMILQNFVAFSEYMNFTMMGQNFVGYA